ncbi:unnamed protein product [Onchocerca flexuosa]|uniref:Uncharacterized protein n=1 Tax=Onchocerca flexuosa TaxID=387005 RepID=A0A183HT34_9BILA|nr:unnamed protein product [Onchocerca flexuosa]
MATQIRIEPEKLSTRMWTGCLRGLFEDSEIYTCITRTHDLLEDYKVKFEMNEKRELCEKYRKFATERLGSDYEEVVKAVNLIVNEVKEYETLLLFINKIKLLGSDEPLKTQTNIGKNIFCEAVMLVFDDTFLNFYE